MGPVLIILSFAVYTSNLVVSASVIRRNKTSDLYPEDFDYIGNGIIRGVANDKTVFEISPSNFAKANLTTLIDWIHWIEELEGQLLKVKEQVNSGCDGDNCHVFMDGMMGGEENKEKRIDAMIRTLKYFQERIEEELRKPEKPWNYPAS